MLEGTMTRRRIGCITVVLPMLVGCGSEESKRQADPSDTTTAGEAGSGATTGTTTAGDGGVGATTDTTTPGGAGTGGTTETTRGEAGTGAAPETTTPGGAGAGGTTAGGSPGDTLSARYPNDDGIDSDPAVLFHDDFEGGWGKWSSPTSDTQYLHLEQDAALAHGGMRYLRSSVTADDLAADTYISSSTRADLRERVNQLFWRFHVRFVGNATNPHHWVRVASGTESWASSGLGDEESQTC